MNQAYTSSVEDLRLSLAEKLGFQSTKVAKPFLNYICNRHLGPETIEEYLELFTTVVEHFRLLPSHANTGSGSTSIKALFEKFASPVNARSDQAEAVKDKIMYILGVWTTMRSDFCEKDGTRRILATCQNPYDNDLVGLLTGSGLLPGVNKPKQPLHQQNDQIVKTAVNLVLAISGMPPSSSLAEPSLIQGVSEHLGNLQQKFFQGRHVDAKCARLDAK